MDPFVAEPQGSALLFDVDGTLAPIVARPDDAAVPERTRERLAALADRYALVGCISGRRAAEARRIVGLEALTYAGNHGLELLEPNAPEPVLRPGLEAHAARVAAFAREAHDDALRALGVRLEDKDAIWAFHWRGAPDEEAARQALERVAEAAEEAGLVPRWGRLVLEVRPPVDADKGTAVEALLERRPVKRALFAGDDTTDLDAFARLRELAATGRLEALCVGVRSEEGPPGILAEADLVVDGTDGVVTLLESLAGES